MKRSILFCSAFFTFLLTSCGVYKPTYLGSSYPATQNVDTYYSAKDVKQSYKVIGHFAVKSPEWNSYQERTKQEVIASAKKQGADGVIFSGIDYQEKDSALITIKAEAIKYDR